jgi:hypothetical protein
VGGGQGLSEPHRRVAHARSLGVELAQPGLELVCHLVECTAQLCELVAALDRHPFVELAMGDASRGLDERGERPHDRAALDVREQRDQHERDEQGNEDAALGRRDRVVDPTLRGEDRHARAGRGRQRIGGEQAIASRSERRRARLARLHVQAPPRARFACDDALADHEHEPVVVGQARMLLQPLGQAVVDGKRGDHSADPAPGAGHLDPALGHDRS